MDTNKDENKPQRQTAENPSGNPQNETPVKNDNRPLSDEAKEEQQIKQAQTERD